MRLNPQLWLAERRLQRLLTAPSGVRAALAEEGDASGASLEALLAGDARASAADRLEVYANAYFARILACLRDDFPALAAALGEVAFHDLATAYLLAFPPRHFSLRYAGHAVARFLASDLPGAGFFQTRWPFAPDLATLEWALLEAFDAPDAPRLGRESLEATPPEAWAELGLRLRPSVALLALDWPVERLRAAHDAGAELPLATLVPEPGTLCVHRSRGRVYFRRVSAREASLLAQLREGTSFGALCDALAAACGEAEAPPLAAAFLARWIEEGTV